MPCYTKFLKFRSQLLAVCVSTLYLFSFDANALIFGPSNYEDCVLENLKNTKTELGIQTVYVMCREKFPEKKQGNSQNEIPKPCYLFWNGLKTTIIQNEPKDWRKTYAQYEISRYGASVGRVFVPKGFELTKESEGMMYRQVEIYCK